MAAVMTRHVQFDRDKLKAAILHVCTTIATERLGAVKLHKTLYLADMIFYSAHGRALTGATYRKRAHGPTCAQLLATLREMEQDGSLRIGQSDYFGLRKTDYLALSAPEPGRLTGDELALLDEVADFVCNRTSARFISELSHERPWEMAESGGVIGYDTALMLFPNEVSLEAMDLVRAEAESIEGARSLGAAVGRSTYADFRSRVQSAHPGA